MYEHLWDDMPDNVEDLQSALFYQRKVSLNQAEELGQAMYEIEKRDKKLLKTQAGLFCTVFAFTCLLLMIGGRRRD